MIRKTLLPAPIINGVMLLVLFVPVFASPAFARPQSALPATAQQQKLDGHPDAGSLASTANQPKSAGSGPDVQTLTFDNDSTIASYCKNMAQPAGANAESLAKVCEYTLSLKYKLPNLLCRRTTTYYDPSSFRHEMTTDVAYQGGIEYDSDLTPDAHHSGPSRFHRAGTSWSSGEFAGDLQGIFLPGSRAEFHFKGSKRLDSTTALVFEYEIAREHNRFYYLAASYPNGTRVISYPGYGGRLWIAKSTSQLLRFELKTTDIDSAFPIVFSKTVIKYAAIELGDGTKLTLPKRADVQTCSLDEHGRDCAHNVVRYTNCRKFGVTTRIVPDQPSTKVKGP